MFHKPFRFAHACPACDRLHNHERGMSRSEHYFELCHACYEAMTVACAAREAYPADTREAIDLAASLDLD